MCRLAMKIGGVMDEITGWCCVSGTTLLLFQPTYCSLRRSHGQSRVLLLEYKPLLICFPTPFPHCKPSH